MIALIVDDNEMSRYQLQFLLGGNGYQVNSAVNGAEALTNARQNPPDLIISDILMPVMDGFTLCQEWKKDERLRKIPFIFYTATYTDERDREFALSLGAERFFVKPEEPEVLIQTIRELTQQAQRPPTSSAFPAASARARLPVEEPPKEESGFLKQYNEVLIRKLEAKMQQLEQTNRELERDITERKRAEEELLFKTALLEAQSESTIDGILVLDRSGRVLLTNRNFARMWNIPEETICSKDDKQVLEKGLPQLKDPDAFLRKVNYLYAHEAEKSRDEVEFKDGRIFDRYSSPLQDSKGKLDGRIWYFRDITARKQLEDQFRQAQRMEAVGRLAGGVAHDFNNLLTIINGYSEMALDRLQASDPLRNYLEQVKRAGDRAASLTRQLLAFSRQLVLEPRVLDLNSLVGEVERMLRRLIGEDVEFVLVLDPALGQVKADPGQIEQILMNLAVNARDAMPQGGKVVIETVNVELDKAYAHRHGVVITGSYVMLAVSDTGIGMDVETQAHIFEPFFTTKEEGKGTGLGLATVYGIVKQSGGSIWVYSELGRGTTFKIYLPRVDETGESVPISEAPGRPVTGSETILLVEDELAVRALAATILHDLGYKVLETQNPEDALQIGEKHQEPIQLLLTDVVMPHLSGRNIAEHLTVLRPGLKVLYMSGYTDDAIVRNGVLETGTAFLQKPFTPASLARKVREVLDAGRHESL